MFGFALLTFAFERMRRKKAVGIRMLSRIGQVGAVAGILISQQPFVSEDDLGSPVATFSVWT